MENATPPRPDVEAVKPRNPAGADSGSFLLRGTGNPGIRYPVLLYRDS